MLRVVLEVLLPLALPTVLYLLALHVAGWARRSGRSGLAWAGLPWLWLAGAGALLLAGVLFSGALGFGTAERGLYVPPRWTGGRIVPGHLEPAR